MIVKGLTMHVLDLAVESYQSGQGWKRIFQNIRCITEHREGRHQRVERMEKWRNVNKNRTFFQQTYRNVKGVTGTSGKGSSLPLPQRSLVVFTYHGYVLAVQVHRNHPETQMWLNVLCVMGPFNFGQKNKTLENTIAMVKHGGGSIILLLFSWESRSSQISQWKMFS